MRIKMLLVALLALSNLAWFVVYRIMNEALVRDATSRNQVYAQLERCQDEKSQLFEKYIQAQQRLAKCQK